MLNKLSIVIVLAASVLTADAQPAPQILNYQGKLVKTNGAAYPNGTVQLRLRVFTAASNGTLRWDSGLRSVSVQSGVFSLALTGGTPTFSGQVFNTGQGLPWFEISVVDSGSVERILFPRQAVSVVPWCFWAETVSDSAITDSKIATGAVTTTKVVNGAIDSTKLASDAASLGKVTGGAAQVLNGTVSIGAPGYVGDVALAVYGRARLVGPDTAHSAGFWMNNTGTDAAFFGLTDQAGTVTGIYGNLGAGFGLTMNNANGRVGIGTTTASQKLDIVGAEPDLTLRLANGSAGHAYRLIAAGSGSGVAPGSFRIFDETVLTDRLMIAPDGNIGIGTVTPSARLHVQPPSGSANIKLAGSELTDNGDGVLRIRSGGNEVSFDGADQVTIQGGTELRFGNAFIDFTGIGSGDYNVRQMNDFNGGLSFYRAGSANGADIHAGPYTQFSSRRFKKDVTPLEGALAMILRLQGVRYRWRNDPSGKRDLGMIAEDVGEVMPELVAWEKNGRDAIGIDYARISAVLVEAVKTQQAQIERLKRENARLRERVAVKDSETERRLARLEARLGR